LGTISNGTERELVKWEMGLYPFPSPTLRQAE